jgi:hypothetical protein
VLAGASDPKIATAKAAAAMAGKREVVVMGGMSSWFSFLNASDGFWFRRETVQIVAAGEAAHGVDFTALPKSNGWDFLMR